MHLLPERYKDRHKYILDLYDECTNLFLKIEKSKSLTVNIDLARIKDQKTFLSLEGEDLLRWLESNGFMVEVSELLRRQCFAGILTDMLQFLLTAMRCSEKGQLNVCYALLRKPLKDSLYYLEQLLVEPEAFLRNFNSSDNVKVFAVEEQTKDQKIQTIRLAMVKSNFPQSQAEYFYAIRYDKKFDLGLEPLFQKANHLITSHQSYRTQNSNLNFVFSDIKAKLTQWESLYTILPSMMLYILGIVSELGKTMAAPPKYWEMLLARYSMSLLYLTTRRYSSVRKTFAGIFSGYEWACDTCNVELKFDFAQFKHFQNDFALVCGNCGHSYDLKK